jgi:hypothetical protein
MTSWLPAAIAAAGWIATAWYCDRLRARLRCVDLGIRFDWRGRR